MSDFDIPEESQELLSAIGAYAAKLGLQAWVVGGAVRDFYLKRPTKDVDCTFDGTQESVAGFCVKTWGGEKHKFSKFGTFRVELRNGFKLDLARLRNEVYAHAGALPTVLFTQNIKEDLFRRDFTVNACALSILPDSFGKKVDPYGAQKDIDKGIIRILHEKSFLDDPTRLFRAVRFAGRFGWKLAPKTEQLLRAAVKEEYPLLVSRDRFSHELIKILEEKNLKPIFKLLEKYDLLKFAWPSLKYHPALEQTQDTALRLGILVLSLGDNGENFLRSLRVPHELAHAILEAWKVQQSALSPMHTLPDFERKLLGYMLPNLPPLALEPCLVHGGELKDLGLAGRRISGVIIKVRKAQWEGLVTTHDEAVKLLLG